MTPTLNIIGCGNVGKALGRLWTENGTFHVQDVLNRSIESSTRAVAFIGGGRAVASLDELCSADIWLIGTPDDQVEASCSELSGQRLFTRGSIVFHCSGALSSTVLASARACGAAVASVHPIRSFADPTAVVADFIGTYCGMEGDAGATQLLAEAFAAIGARLVHIDPEHKRIYHAAAVISSNYLVTLLDVAVETYAKAGVPREEALSLMEPLVRGAVDNVFRLGTTDALTGPIARGDVATVLAQYRAVNAWDRSVGALYKRLGKFTAKIARRKRSRG